MATVNAAPFWRRRRVSTVEEASLAIGRAAADKEDAKERLVTAENISVEACVIAETLRVAREENHFAERIRMALGDSRG